MVTQEYHVLTQEILTLREHCSGVIDRNHIVEVTMVAVNIDLCTSIL